MGHDPRRRGTCSHFQRCFKTHADDSILATYDHQLDFSLPGKLIKSQRINHLPTGFSFDCGFLHNSVLLRAKGQGIGSLFCIWLCHDPQPYLAFAQHLLVHDLELESQRPGEQGTKRRAERGQDGSFCATEGCCSPRRCPDHMPVMLLGAKGDRGGTLWRVCLPFSGRADC